MKLKKVFSLLLAVAMVLGTMFVPVAAEEHNAVAQVSSDSINQYITLQDAINAADNGDTITVIADIKDEEVTVAKSLTITADPENKPTLNNVSITADGTGVALTVSNLEFTGTSYINANNAAALTVDNVDANVELNVDNSFPATNSRAAFIALGASEPTTPLLLTVTNNNIVVTGNNYPDPVLGWRYIADRSVISYNTFGSEETRHYDAVKLMNMMDGATITLEGNTVYCLNGHGNGFAFGQNCSRENSYNVEIKDNTFYGEADYIWVEASGATETNAIVNATGNNTVTVDGEAPRALTIDDLKKSSKIKLNYYMGIDVVTDADGKVISGTLTKASNSESLAEGYVLDADGEVVLEPIPLPVTYEVATKDDLVAAIANATDGERILLTADIDYGNDHLEIKNAIILDLGGKTLTTRARNYGLALNNNACVVTNGKLIHAGTVAAIKVWDAKEISNLEIDVTGTSSSGNTINGIVIQENAAGVDTIKNVTIHSTSGQGVAIGIETYNCGNATENVIGSMENVTIDAADIGMNISAPCGTATNCSIKGGTTGIELWVKGTYSATLDLIDCDVAGGEHALDIHDEYNDNPNIVNNGLLKLTADDASAFTSERGTPLKYTIARAENIELSENIQAMMSLEGEGTEASPYLIRNAEELTWFASDVNSGNTYKDKYVKLNDDIDLKDADWTPIGNASSPFYGSFDGNNKTISNLRVAQTAQGAGLFGYIGKWGTLAGTIKDLTLDTVSNCQDQASAKMVGSLAGFANAKLISNITVKNANLSGYADIGGLVGTGNTTELIDKCTVEVKISECYGRVGGIVGGNAYCDITNCYADVDITSGWAAGGIVGLCNGCSLKGNYVTGSLKASANYGDRYKIGGIVGTLNESLSGQAIENNYCNATVTNYDHSVVKYFPVIGMTNIKNITSENMIDVSTNSWNREIFDTDTIGIINLDDVKDGEYTVPRNNNLVMLENDLKYVDAKSADDVTIMAFSAVTKEQVAKAIESNKPVAFIDVNGNGQQDANEVICASLQDAINAANNGDTIKLLGNVSNSGGLTLGKDITIDLNGYILYSTTAPATALTLAADSSSPAFVEVTGNVTMQNGTLDLSNAAAVDHGLIFIRSGKLTVKDMKIVASNLPANNVFYMYYTTEERLVLDNVKVDLSDQEYADGRYFIKCELNSGNETVYPTVTIKDSDINIARGQGGFNMVNLAVESSNITMTDMGQHIIRRTSGTITDSTIKADGNETFIKNTNGESLTFRGNTIVEKDDENAIILDNGTITITGIKYNFDPTAYVSEGYKVVKQDDYYYVVPEFTVSAVSDKPSVKAGETVTVSIKVTGGDFTNADWTLVYDGSKVNYAGASNYTITGEVGKVGSSSIGNEYKDGDTVATYTFTVLQSASGTALFDITEAHVDSYAMSDYLDKVLAKDVDTEVQIGDASLGTVGTLAASEVTYNGYYQMANAVELFDESKDITVTYTNKLVFNGTGSALPPSFKDVGTYPYFAAMTAEGYDNSLLLGKMIINPKEVVPTVTFNVDPAVDSVVFTPEINGLVDDSFTGTVTVTITDEAGNKIYENTFAASDFIYGGASTAIGSKVDVDGVKGGNLTAAVTYTAGEKDNYKNGGNTTVTIDVNKLTLDDISDIEDAFNGVFPYDGKPHAVEVDDTKLPEGWNVKTLPTGTVTNVGDDKMVQVVVEDKNGKYNDVIINVVLKVTPLAVTLTVKNAEKAQGAADPAFGYSIDPALVNSGDLGSIKLTRQQGETPGSYTIYADYTHNKNYDVTVKTGKLEIGAPDYVVEVVDNTAKGTDTKQDYVAGYRMILVYTDADQAYFTYDGQDMYDVTAADYKYVDNDYTSGVLAANKSDHAYKHIYAIVVKASGYEATEAYEKTLAEKVTFIGSENASLKITYDADINLSSKLDFNDCSDANGIYNALADNMVEMMSILKADRNRDKMVDTDDALDVNTTIFGK